MANQPSLIETIAILIAFHTVMSIILFIEWRWYRTTANLRLREWAERNGYLILESRLRYFFRGPFFWYGGGQAVFRVVIEERKGNRRVGWVGLGSYWFGPLSSSGQADVIWD
jgi:hypothetical protein